MSLTGTGNCLLLLAFILFIWNLVFRMITFHAYWYVLFVYFDTDLAHAFSSISRDANFIDHTSELGWKEWGYFSHIHGFIIIFYPAFHWSLLFLFSGDQIIRPIVVDPGLYLARRTQIYCANEKCPMPNAFKFSQANSPPLFCEWDRGATIWPI